MTDTVLQGVRQARDRFGDWENVFFVDLNTNLAVATINDGLLRAVITGVNLLGFDPSLGGSGFKGSVLVRWYVDGERLVEEVSRGLEPDPYPNVPIEIAVSSPGSMLYAIKQRVGVTTLRERIAEIITRAVARFLIDSGWSPPFIGPEVEEVFVDEVTLEQIEEVLLGV